MSLFHGEADGGIPSSGLSSDLAGSTGFSSAGKLLQPCWSLPAQNVNFVIKNLWFRSLFTLHSQLQIHATSSRTVSPVWSDAD